MNQDDAAVLAQLQIGLDELRATIAPYVLRRTREEVLEDLGKEEDDLPSHIRAVFKKRVREASMNPVALSRSRTKRSLLHMRLLARLLLAWLDYF